MSYPQELLGKIIFNLGKPEYQRKHITGAWLNSYITKDANKNSWVLLSWIPRKNSSYVPIYDVIKMKNYSFSKFNYFFEKGVPSEILKVISNRRKTRDYQKQKVYNWEAKYIHPFSKKLSLLKCRSLIQLILPKNTPILIDGKNTLRALWSKSKNCIIIPNKLKLNSIVMHECSHSITDSNINGFHGPRFVRNYIDLLITYGNWKENKLMKGINEYKIDI